MSAPTCPLPASPPLLTIAAVERDTRISKDTLRVWERRYGFPAPERDANGERLYPAQQVSQLRHIKRLMDAGHRPGRIVGLSLEGLEQLGSTTTACPAEPLQAGSVARQDSLVALVQLLRSHNIGTLRHTLTQALLGMGLERFVTEMAVPLMTEIGWAWSRGELEIFQEHLCSEALETVLRAAIASAPDLLQSGHEPRVLLATVPTESHGLGLLMADALFCVEGCNRMDLGVQAPLREIVLAAQAHRAQIVALSFSSAMNLHHAVESLTELRAALDSTIEIWAGTSAPSLLKRGVAGVKLMSRLDGIAGEVARWRSKP
ncbi:MAG: MerR family transcriptional regulator [Leptothrix sp. (in: b-proteobacteria)]